ncbi:unnamed protein product, partial [Brenthis ino]
MEICQACLRTGEYVNPMTAQDLKYYRLFITKVEDPLNIIYICIYCRSLLRKIVKFIEQCQTADLWFQDAINKVNETPITLNNLSKSSITYNYLGPQMQIDVKLEDVKSDVLDEDDIPLVLLNENHDYDNSSYFECEDRLESPSSKESIVKDESLQIAQIKKSVRKKTKKKVVKEGFSSRMVTETNEYTVIKLKKEQILEEMQQYANSERYKMLPYKCEKCVKGFNFEDVLQSHMEKHSVKNGPFQCELCEQYCPSKVSLRGHMKSHSSRYKCKLCNIIRLSRQHILEHYSLEHAAAPAVYSCPTCEYTTNKRTAMQRHVRVHSSNEPLKCHICGKYYKSKDSLRIHIMRHDDKKLHQCSACSSSFVYAAQLRRHALAVHVRADFYCVECDVVFKSRDNLKRHLQRAKKHRDSSAYKHQCTQCEQRFVSSSSLASHGARAHGGARPEACAHCGRRYCSRDALRWHARSAHAPRAPRVPCALCGRTFSRKYVLRVHMRTHTGERPHACHCGAAFTQASALRAHVAAKHKCNIVFKLIIVFK